MEDAQAVLEPTTPPLLLNGYPGQLVRPRRAARTARLARQEVVFEKLEASAEVWVPEVHRYLPTLPWEEVVRFINAGLPKERRWTLDRLRRAAQAYVRDGLLPQEVLAHAPRRDGADRLVDLMAGIKGAVPDITLEAICDRFDAIQERTARGRLPPPVHPDPSKRTRT